MLFLRYKTKNIQQKRALSQWALLPLKLNSANHIDTPRRGIETSFGFKNSFPI